ncbi:MAG: hypothetical protein Q9169_002025 [Polycauliona sp. 2 TL-2023]
MSHTPRTSTDSSNQDHFWFAPEDFERPQKSVDFPSAGLHNKISRHDLRINPYSKSDLHERYMSSEEEPSPSPDSSDAESTASDELKHKSSSRVLSSKNDSALDLSSVETDSTTTAIAVAMPIVAYGRPKLIDITNLAPMHKRKRTIKQPVGPSTTMAKQTLARTTSTSRLAQTKAFVANEAAEMVVPAEKAAIIAHKQAAMAAGRRLKEERMQSLSRTPSSAPESWLPEEQEEEQPPPHSNIHSSTGGEREYHFPSSSSDTDPDYGPYNLEPIQPSPHRPAHFPPPASSSNTRKRNNSNPFTIVTPTNLGKGFTRTWSIAKKGVHHHGSLSSTTSAPSSASLSSSMSSGGSYQPRERQITKKPKMIARGANEREEAVLLPPFAVEGTA